MRGSHPATEQRPASGALVSPGRLMACGQSMLMYTGPPRVQATRPPLYVGPMRRVPHCTGDGCGRVVEQGCHMSLAWHGDDGQAPLPPMLSLACVLTCVQGTARSSGVCSAYARAVRSALNMGHSWMNEAHGTRTSWGTRFSPARDTTTRSGLTQRTLQAYRTRTRRPPRWRPREHTSRDVPFTHASATIDQHIDLAEQPPPGAQPHTHQTGLVKQRTG